VKFSPQSGSLTQKKKRAAVLPLAVTLALALLTGTRCLAAIHPVPLDKNTDAAKCLECHSDKNHGKAVHSAMAQGCTTCHEIRVNRDVTRVKLITTTAYKLCLSCHTDKDATQIKGHVHKPAVRDCLTCHDPHTSDNKNQLLAPGIFGRVQLFGGEYDALLIPDTAIISDQSRKIVFAVGEDNVVKAKPVTLGPLVDGLRVVRDGLAATDQVVLDGLANPMVRPGAKVVPQKGEINTAKAK